MDNPMYEKLSPDMSTWKGRERDDPCRNSFGHFVSLAKRTNAGKDHLRRHHGGYTGKKIDNDPDDV